MPEGDTIRGLAERLDAALSGRRIVRCRAQALAPASFVGRAVTRARSHGKQLMIDLEGDLTLLAHLKMTGRVFVRRGPAKEGGPEPQLSLDVGTAHATFSRVPLLRLVSRAAAARTVAALGEDLAGAPDVDAVLARLRERPRAEIAVALLDQRALAGVGNEIKSEALFLEGLSPFVRVEAIDDARLRALVLRAARIVKENVGRRRATRASLAGPRVWVYGRAGRPCLRCGEIVRRALQGPHPGRSTYHCPRCQPAPAGGNLPFEES